MPRKLRIAKTEREVPLTPALEYWLTSGEHATVRVHGWFDLMVEGPEALAALGDAAWEAHHAAITATAAAYGFRPSRLTGRPPRGPGVARWRADFLAPPRTY